MRGKRREITPETMREGFARIHNFGDDFRASIPLQPERLDEDLDYMATCLDVVCRMLAAGASGGITVSAPAAIGVTPEVTKADLTLVREAMAARQAEQTTLQRQVQTLMDEVAALRRAAAAVPVVQTVQVPVPDPAIRADVDKIAGALNTLDQELLFVRMVELATLASHEAADPAGGRRQLPAGPVGDLLVPVAAARSVTMDQLITALRDGHDQNLRNAAHSYARTAA